MGKKEKFYASITALHPEVSGSCIHVCVKHPDGRKNIFIVDCGLFQEKKYEQLNKEKFPFDCENIDFVLITHNHTDHMARLPMLTKGGFYKKIYATKATSHLMGPALMNSYQIMKENAKRMKLKPLYDDTDVENVLMQVVPCELEKTIDVNDGIKITYCDNGHLIGAGMILVQISEPGEEDINLFFTGDYKPDNLLKEVNDIPDWITELPVTIVIESTYGNIEKSEIKKHFEEDIERLLKDGKSLILPLIAQERVQSTLYKLKMMQEDGRISKDIPMSLDGKLAQTYTNMFRNCDLGLSEDKIDFLPENLTMVDKKNRGQIIGYKGQQIILTTSGMLDHGPAQIYIPEFIENENYVFYISNYCAEGTLGRKLLEAEENSTIKLLDNEYQIKASIMWTEESSSHGKANELEALLRKFKHPELVLINHGEESSQEAFAERVDNAKITKDVELLSGHSARVTHYGLSKIMGAKLYNMPEIKAKKEKIKEKAKKLKYFKRKACIVR